MTFDEDVNCNWQGDISYILTKTLCTVVISDPTGVLNNDADVNFRYRNLNIGLLLKQITVIKVSSKMYRMDVNVYWVILNGYMMIKIKSTVLIVRSSTLFLNNANE